MSLGNSGSDGVGGVAEVADANAAAAARGRKSKKMATVWVMSAEEAVEWVTNECIANVAAELELAILQYGWNNDDAL